MKLKKMHFLGIGIGIIILILDFIFFFDLEKNKTLFLFLIGIALAVIALPVVVGFVLEGKKEEEINSMFLEFTRNLAESVAIGTPINKSIINISKKNYGSLTPYIQKLANQILLGVPLNKALENFAEDIDNDVIRRAIALINEAERAGGEINSILESTAKSINEIEILKKERKASIYNLIVQGYIIFFVFIGIMLVMEFKILPLTEGIEKLEGIGLGTGFEQIGTNKEVKTTTSSSKDLSDALLYLLIAQGFFAGLIIGKLAEGKIKAGIKHSFIMMITAFLISMGARLFFNK